jgi:hypothetical protein
MEKARVSWLLEQVLVMLHKMYMRGADADGLADDELVEWLLSTALRRGMSTYLSLQKPFAD